MNMTFAQQCNRIFDETVALYHLTDDVDFKPQNPYAEHEAEHTLFAKNWIDAVQWHLEDIIRDPEIDPVEALALKRRIDRSNQERSRSPMRRSTPRARPGPSTACRYSH